jgi:hypothetical protein
MPIGVTPSHYDGEATQSNLPYVDGTVWNTDSQLLSSDFTEMILLYVSGTTDEMNVGQTANIREGSIR